MSHPIIVLGPDNSSMPFCEVACYHTFTFYQENDDQISAKKLSRSPHNCFHCAACGRLIYEAEGCMLHDEACPDWIWYASYPNTYDFMDCYLSHQGERPPAEAFEIADDIASRNQLIGGNELAVLTLRKMRLL